MKFREHKGGLGESMETVVELADHQALLEHLRKLLEPWPSAPPVTEKTLFIKPHCFDQRNQWDTHIVFLAGYGVVGMTDGPV